MKNSVINIFDHKDTDVMSPEFYYGDVYQQTNKGKFVKFRVTNHLEQDKTYKFRYIGKARAGFPCIFDRECTPKELCYYLSKSVKNVQVFYEHKDGSGKGFWMNIMTFKGSTFDSVDKSILDNLTVSDMHSSFPTMVDYDLWKRIGAKTHASKAYMYNEKNENK